jgi:putative flippase GtrA
MIHVRTIPRYLVVGGICALLGNAILILFDRIGLSYLTSCLVSFVVTVLIAYRFHTGWTFGAQRSLLGLFQYGAAMALNLPVALALLFLLVTVWGLPMTVAAPTLTVLQTALNYAVAAVLMRSRVNN